MINILHKNQLRSIRDYRRISGARDSSVVKSTWQFCIGHGLGSQQVVLLTLKQTSVPKKTGQSSSLNMLYPLLSLDFVGPVPCSWTSFHLS